MVIPEYFTIRVHRVTTPFSGRPHADVAITNFDHLAIKRNLYSMASRCMMNSAAMPCPIGRFGL